MIFFLPILAFVVAMFGGMLVCLEIGRRMGRRRLAEDPKEAMTGLGTVEGMVFGLYGLLLAFTFSGATSRLEERIHLIQEEANAIGTAYLRVDLLPSEVQPAMRQRFRDYVDSRLSVYQKFPDVVAAMEEYHRSAKIQNEIWTQAVIAGHQPGADVDATKLLLPALNAMIDITSTRLMAARIHPPMIIYGLLYVLALVASLIAGFSMSAGKRRSWLHITLFAAFAVITVYVILDLEYPRLGFFRINSYDQALVEVRQSM